MEKEEAKKIIEALLYMTDHALNETEILDVLEQKRWAAEDVQQMVKEISDDYEAKGSPLRVVAVAGGIQMATKQDVAPWIRRLYKERLTVRLSPSALETLSIIAYKQPISRSDIEQIRGVEATGVMETLLERRLVKVVGRKETIGRPLLYGTTVEFLRHFGLKHLTELPDVSTYTFPESTPPQEPAVQQEKLVAVSSASEAPSADQPSVTP